MGGLSWVAALYSDEEAETVSKAVYIYNELFLRTGAILESGMGWL